MKRILLSQGFETLVDDEDYEFLINFGSWYTHSCGQIKYAARTQENGSPLYMHRVIMCRMEPNFSGIVDHIDRDGLNNRRNNLRIATHSQNHANCGLRSDNVSGFKGVSWSKVANKWWAYIRHKGTTIHLGFFDSKIKAARAYNNAALRLFGEFAKLNDIEEKINGK